MKRNKKRFKLNKKGKGKGKGKNKGRAGAAPEGEEAEAEDDTPYEEVALLEIFVDEQDNPVEFDE